MKLNTTFTFPTPPPASPTCLVQLAAQVLDDLDDEDIGFGLVDEKKDSAVAKRLGKPAATALISMGQQQYSFGCKSYYLFQGQEILYFDKHHVTLTETISVMSPTWNICTIITLVF